MATYAGDTSSSAKTNYARLGHASQDLIPKLLQQLLLFYEPTYKIRKDCLLNSYLSNKCNAIEWNNICKANTDGYVDFDVPLIYKLLRNLKLIPKPTRGWEPQGGPMITETTIGDDLERFRKSRNEILHRGNANVSDEELTEYFTQFKDIAQRLELVLNKKKNELVSEFQNLETCCMDDVSEQILANLAKKEKDESPNEKSALIKKPLQDVCCVEGEIACLSCEIIEDETAVTWYKDDAEIFPSTDIILKMHDKIHELSIPGTELKDGGRYSIKVKQSTSEATLTVKALISKHLVDRTCLEGSTIVLSCEVSVEDISGIWYKDDSIVVQSNQIHPTVNSRIHQLNIFQSEIKDGGKYVFKIRDKISSAILTVKAVIKKHLENVTCIEDQSLSLVCELAEKDISVTWLKDEKVIEASKNIVPEIDNNAHILKFKKLSKNDGGKYALMAKGKKTEAVVLVIAKSTIPDQILQMDEKDKEMYLEIIKSGTERRYYIRLMIVGENGVGKTCLMRRLLGEDIDDVTSTDGIDVVIRKCKIRISDGQWILNEEDTVKQDRNVRMKRALTDKDSILPEEKIREKQAESLLEDDPMETTVTPFGNVKGEEIKNVTEIKDIYTGKVMDQKNDVDMQFTNELKEESIAESVPLHTDKDVALKSEKRVELSDTLSDAMNVELTKDIFADCNVWDFAGQKEFYATHQTFLTNSAIYLLTTDLSKDLSSQSQTKICDVEFDKIGCYIDFWFDTIHCYATTEAPDQSVDKPMSDKLKPPIIIVCTGTDKIKGELSEQKSLFRRQLNSILSRQITYKHVRYIQYLSNKEPLENDFLELKSTIFKTATEMSSWGKELPLRWIHLETALDGERDAGSNILPFHLVVELAKDSSLHTSDNEEIILFLRYQHECGHVIFFKDLPHYIILNPRWLIDVFKCFVSADQFMGDLLNVDDWEELKETGKLSNTLISMLFEKVSTLKLMKYKEHVLRVLEKFDIIVKPTVENMTSKLYYMPCMIKPRSFKEMRDRFHVDEQSCRRTSWLLLEFEFLPPAFFNHVLVGCIRKFNVNIETGRRLSLYRGISVFDIDKLGNRKLVICAHKNLIAFQIWIYDHELLGTFHDFRHTLTNMVDMLSERYQICCKYKVKLKCSESDYKEEEGRFELKDLQDDKTYYCPEHGIAHACLDVYEYWFSDKYPEGYLEAQAKEEEEAGEVTKKEKRERDDNDSSPSGTPEKKKLVGDKIDPDQLKLMKEDEGNKILWNEAKEFSKEGAQVDGLVIKEEEQDVKMATIEFLKITLEEEGLHFRGSIPDDGNSFFEACSDQLQRLEISGHTHSELRQMVIPTLKFCSENEIKSANFTSDTWKIFIDKVAKDKENVEDIVVETMAKLLRRQIIVYSKSYTNDISRKKFNEEANGTPLLLAKDELYYQSLERRHGTPSRQQESNTSNIADAVVLHADDDRDAAIEFIRNMEREFPDLNLSITLYENLTAGTNLLESAVNLYDRCRFLFVFVTQNFVNADLPRILNTISLIKTISFQEKNNRLIPVSTDSNGDLPDLALLMPLKYSRYLQAKSEQRSDSSFLESFKMLITDGRKKYLCSKDLENNIGKTETESTKPAPKPVPKQTRRVKSPRDPPENSQISAQDFLPFQKSEHPKGNKPSQNVTEDSVLKTVENGHDAMSAILSSRSKNLQIVRAMWTSGNTKTALDSAISMRDPSVIVDLLNVLNLKTGLWNLDLCSSLLPQVKELLNSKYESHVEAACNALKIILRNFGPVIKANITTAPNIGVDLSREERIQKCNSCYNYLSEVRIIVEKKQSASGKLGNLLKEVQILMAQID